ncbi:hypothetical protein [Lentilactobacillus kisonensis]|uniref:Uncharacterized protein n=1 Tax=Lentilactobacillus kisonensis F0435 TaxID=797516 RepID=H1LF88_9LACO|nr:hypothetical protein [Lentilactobacillus kisonensis]EHO51947.1 hypothetical protein HMPREF9104_01264 [Lentilactobacillus kisonensis F0435]
MEKYGHVIPTRKEARRQREVVARQATAAKQKAAVRINGLETTVEVDQIVDVGTFPRVKKITKSE